MHNAPFLQRFVDIHEAKTVSNISVAHLGILGLVCKAVMKGSLQCSQAFWVQAPKYSLGAYVS